MNGNQKRNKGKSKSNKSYKKQGYKQNKDWGSEDQRPRTNDVSWWSHSELYDDATNVPFNILSGAVYDYSKLLPTDGSFIHTPHGELEAQPSVMQIKFVPHVGYSADVNSPVNRAFTSVYAQIYSKTTGAMQFTQANLAYNTLAIDSIITNIGAVKRGLAISHMYLNNNLAFPRLMLEAVGFDPDSIIGNQDEIRQRINNCIRNLNAIQAVNLFALNSRHYQLITNIYKDAPNDDSRMYVFAIDGYYVYRSAGTSEYFDTEGLEFHFIEDKMDIFEFIDIIDQQLSAIRHSSSFGYVSGSIQRAFPEAELVRIEPVSPDMIVKPEFDRNMIYQIMNSNFVTEPELNSLHITEDVVGDYIVARPCADAAVPAYKFMSRQYDYLRTWDDNHDKEFVMEATRLKVMGQIMDGKLVFTNFGVDLCTQCTIYQLRKKSATNEYFVVRTMYNTLSNYNTIGMDGVLSMTRFAHAPLIWIWNGEQLVHNALGFLGTHTLIHSDSLRGLNQAALLSAYNPEQFKPRL